MLAGLTQIPQRGRLMPRTSVAAFDVDAALREVSGDVFRFLVARLGTEADARDALQETLLAAWRSRAKLRDPSSFRAWVFGIAANKSRDALRNRSRQGRVSPLGAAEPREGDAAGLLDALDELPRRDREVLLLRYLVGLSERETAQALGVRLGTVKSRTARASQRLREILGEGEGG